MKQYIYDLVEANPVIASVKDMEGLKECCELEDIKVVFILFGDICSIGDLVGQVKKAGKVAFVHLDLIGGFSSREVIVDFIKGNTEADGVISTKPQLIKYAQKIDLCTVLRIFILDSMSLYNLDKQLDQVRPDILEILPGIMPKITQHVCKIARLPVIAGGLVMEKNDVVDALKAGAIAVSSTNQKVWKM